MSSHLRIKDGYKVVMELFTPYRRRIYEYNSLIRETGYYLKPIHVVVKKVDNTRSKYVYFGRYWYRVVRNPNGRIQWIYVGREKPDPQLPEPPLNPFEGLRIIVYEDDVVVDEHTYRVLNMLMRRVSNNTKLL